MSFCLAMRGIAPPGEHEKEPDPKAKPRSRGWRVRAECRAERLERAIQLALTTFAEPDPPPQLYDDGYTNGMAIRAEIFPCETDPRTGNLSKLGDPFHASATVTAGSKVELTRCCRSCAAKWHWHKEQREGIRWA